MSPHRHSPQDRDAGYYQGIICLEIAIGKVAVAVRDRIFLQQARKSAKPIVSRQGAPRGIADYATYFPSSTLKLSGFAGDARFF
jgi:hypothetical protein